MCQLNSFSGIENFWKGFTENRRPAWFPQTWSFTFTWDPQTTYPHHLSSLSPLICRTQDRLNLPFLYSGGAAHLRFRPMSGNSCRSFSWRSARRAMFLSLMLIGVGLLSVAAELPRLEQPAKNDGSLSLLVVGDWGRRGGYNQSKVAAQVRQLSSLFNPFLSLEILFLSLFLSRVPVQRCLICSGICGWALTCPSIIFTGLSLEILSVSSPFVRDFMFFTIWRSNDSIILPFPYVSFFRNSSYLGYFLPPASLHFLWILERRGQFSASPDSTPRVRRLSSSIGFSLSLSKQLFLSAPSSLFQFLLIGISRYGGSADLKGRKEVEYPSMIHISL